MGQNYIIIILNKNYFNDFFVLIMRIDLLY